MFTPQEIEGGIRVDDAESVDLCPWVEFYPDVVGDIELNNYLRAAVSITSAISEHGIKTLDSNFCRVETGKNAGFVALKFGFDDVEEWTVYSCKKMFGVDAQPIINAGKKLDDIVDFQHNNEVVVYNARNDLKLHIDNCGPKPISVRRCLLSLDGLKTNVFLHPLTGQLVSSLTTPGSAVSLSYGAIQHAVHRRGETYSVYIQSDK